MKSIFKNSLQVSLSFLLAFYFTTAFSQVTFTINNTPIAGDYTEVGEAQFGPMPIGTVTGNLVIVDDGVAANSETDACEPLINGAAISGNIALADRGACYFIDKVINSENVGAIAAVICNINPGEGVINMSSPAGLETDIPSIFLTLELCDSIRAEMVNGTVSITISDEECTEEISYMVNSPDCDLTGATVELFDASGASIGSQPLGMGGGSGSFGTLACGMYSLVINDAPACYTSAGGDVGPREITTDGTGSTTVNFMLPSDEVPTLGEWGLILLALLMLITAVVGIRQRQGEREFS